MSRVYFDVSAELNNIFGIANVVTYPDAVTESQSQNPQLIFDGIQQVDQEELEEEMSWLGTPILFPITFKGGDYKTLRKGQVETTSVGDFRLPGSAVATFSRKKIKPKSRAGGGRGSLKELYAFDDWQITINGICIPDPKHPQKAFSASQQEERLLQFEDLTDSVEILGSQFRRKGIFRMDIDQITFPAVVGKHRYIPFTIIGESDEPLELTIL